MTLETTTTETPLTDRDQLRLVIAGSVDDGKSTLVGRLLHDTKSILADQFEATLHASQGRGATEFDLALLTDGLRAEREQGITIDVAYRYFATPRRNFVLADTPGHVQYTRNTVTGASTAEAAVVLVDVRNGVSPQTRRHAAVLSLLRVPQVVFAINKMDAVDWSEDRFAAVADEVRALAERVGLEATHIIPVSALTGENVAGPGPDWYAGLPLLEVLEQLPARSTSASEPFRLPVQLVIRPRTPEHPDYRGLAGRVASGSVRVGDTVTAYPSGRSSTVLAIDGATGEVPQAAAGDAVTIRLADELDVGRGEVLATEPVRVTQELDAVVTWLDERPAAPRQRVLVKVGTKTTRALLAAPHAVWHVDDLEWQDSSAPLELNDIGRLRFQLAEPVAVDDYAQLRATGAFVVIDPDTGATLAAGLTGSDLGALAS
ncbi:MAG TPA: GTP-binding protein [Flexivirga sp.]|uniref:sulfate adenylyltransferase subunit 1 n=1 Tax=Flexivirga sp. TaxID=1962927 RepID=UPI002BC118AC|nr:GTP-binding protein [Flexivirga sp.]HWC23100.1 GTP-binding protein [Flexivirga sp.]